MVTPYDPVQQTFEKCIRDFKAELKDDKIYCKILQTTTIDQVYDLTDKLQEEQAKDGHMRHLSKIGPFLERLRGYGDAIDTFVQVKPDIMALIWGPIKLLLQWTDTVKQSFDAIVNTIGDIGDLLPEFQEVTRLFGHNEQIKDVLALFFRDLLDFYIIALKFFSQPRWKIMFEAMWPRQRDKIKIVMSHIERHTLLVRNEVRLEHIREEHEARLKALEHFEKSEKSHRRQEYNAIRENISPRTYEEDLYRLDGRICEGTGKWLLKDPIFDKWLNESEKEVRFIWLQGIPGAGKTFLSGTVVDKAIAQGRTLFAFLSYRFSSSISALSLIHSLLFQLASDDDDVQEIICQSAGKELKRDLKISVKLLTTVLNVAGTNGPVFIIIDGLDEIDEIERARLLCCLLELSNSCEEVKILVSSRIEDDIHAILHDKVVEIRVDSRNAGSIQVFISRRVCEWFDSRHFLPEAREQIMRMLAPLSSKADGMFLYAKVVLSSIEHLDDMIAIRNELEVLPENLDDAYARILERISNLNPPALRDKARKLLGWIGSSLTPLTIREIEQALLIRMNEGSDIRVIATLNPVRICGPILEVVDDYVQFVHFTAKEYIFSPNIPTYINISDATLSLATCCIQYLCQKHHDTYLSDDEFQTNVLLGAYRLHEYSVTMWINLLDRYRSFNKATILPESLINLLRLFSEKRSSDEFNDDGESKAAQTLSQQLFKTDCPDISEMLCNAAYFQQKCSEGEFDKRKGTSWINLDPLTSTRTSIRLYEVFDELLCRDRNFHKNDCHCSTIQQQYGQRPFKCSFLGCSFSRHGFQTNSARNSHQRCHDLPWKCNKSGCPYSQGFLSRKMRDQHWERCHQEGRKATLLQQDPDDDDDLQPLLFDLVRNDKVELFKILIPRFKKCKKEVKLELLELASSSGSVAMLDLFKPYDVHTLEAGVLTAIRARNLENYRYFLPELRRKHFKVYTFDFPDILAEILNSRSEELRVGWEIHIDLDREHWTPVRAMRPSSCFGERYIRHYLLETAIGNPENEAFILSVWQEIKLTEDLPERRLGYALCNVAATCCSIKLATYLIDAGAPIDYRRSISYLTPLHHAAKQKTSEAAELMRFLLILGADPEACTRSGPRNSRRLRYVRDETGAQGISQWLGMSWDELVEKTKAERRTQNENSP